MKADKIDLSEMGRHVDRRADGGVHGAEAPRSLSLPACVGLLLVALHGRRRPARAAPPSVQLEELTWTEVKAALQSGTTTIIIPAGGTEQSGPHMALGKHNVRARVLAGRIAATLGDTLVAPVLAYVPEGAISPPVGHMRFPGTISIPDAAFKSTLEAAARSFRQAGFTHIVLLGDHGGYQTPAEAGRRRPEPGMGRPWRARPFHRRVLRRDPDRLCAGAAREGLQRRPDRRACRRGRYVLDDGDRSGLCARRSPAAVTARQTERRAIRRRRARHWASLAST